MHLSQRVESLAPSSTLAVTAKAKALQTQGVDVIGFGAGEPDFDTPPNIKDAAKRAIDAGYTHYMPIAGDPPAREAVVAKLRIENGLTDLRAENVLITAGGKHAFFLLTHTLFDPGGHLDMLLPTPAWVSYKPIARMAGARVVEIATTVEDDFKISPERLAAVLTSRSRLLVINSPSNPCGTTYTPDELQALAAIVNEHNRRGGQLIVAGDDIYEKLVYGDCRFESITHLIDPPFAVTLNALSKAYAMTGWRVGYVAGSRPLIDAMIKLQGQMTTCIPAFCYPAIVEALANGAASVAKMRSVYEQRAELIHRLVQRLPDVRCPRPTGAFYVFPDVSATLGRRTPGGRVLRDCITFSEALLEEAHVAVVPGDEFGPPGENHVRLSFACSTAQIEEGLARIERFLRSLS